MANCPWVSSPPTANPRHRAPHQAAPTEGAEVLRKLRALYRRDDGMTTAEYAVGLIAAVAFAGILYKVVTSGTVQTALTTIVKRALSHG
jgi:Flp pilus assembly pilin Flp